MLEGSCLVVKHQTSVSYHVTEDNSVTIQLKKHECYFFNIFKYFKYLFKV